MLTEVADEELNKRCAWGMVVEINTRILIRNINFNYILFIDCLKELEEFANEARLIMKKAPVYFGKPRSLGLNIMDLLREIISPFFQKWRNSFLLYWNKHSENVKNPFLLQQSYPEFELLIQEWEALRDKIYEHQTNVLNPILDANHDK